MSLKYLARGVGGVDEMRHHLVEDNVLYGVVRLRLGRGTFARYKSVMIHHNPDSAPVVRRGRANAMKQMVEERLSPIAMSVTTMTSDEATSDAVVEELARVCARDEGAGQTPSDFQERVTTMKADVKEQVAEARKMLEEVRARETKRLRRLTLREIERKMSFREVANIVRNENGAFNWYVLRADANGNEVVNAGGGSLEEMKSTSLPSNEVLFGLLRMGFGRGAFRRTKLVFLHWSGEDVPALKRGQLNAHEEAIRKLVGATNVNHFATSIDELDLSELIEKVKNKVVLDGEACENMDDLYSLESFLVATEEDGEALKREFPETVPTNQNGTDEGEEREPTFGEALASVNDSSQPYNWMLCSL